jgi:hypothetical protein
MPSLELWSGLEVRNCVSGCGSRGSVGVGEDMVIELDRTVCRVVADWDCWILRDGRKISVYVKFCRFEV